MRTPRIGVTCGSRAPDAYRQALEATGAQVVELGPDTAAWRAADGDPAAALTCIDGLCLTGGLDVDPRHYRSERVHPSVRIDEDRDRLELPLAALALEAGVPMLGICRGIQLLNVVAGGTLWQDLPSERPSGVIHMEPSATRDRRRLLHTVRPEPASLLARVVGDGARGVNSIHHQAVREPAPGFRVNAYSADGVVEGLERPGEVLVLAVQWHPEELTAVDPAHARLFEALTDAARAVRGT